MTHIIHFKDQQADRFILISPLLLEEATASTNEPSSSVASAIRLRTPCDNCQDTKVKCSQDKPAYGRCAGKGISCVYSPLNNLLLKRLSRYAPGIDPHDVLIIGAGGIQNAFSGDTLRGVRHAFIDGLRGAWALGIALFAGSCLCAFIAKWPGKLMPDEKQEERESV